MMTRTGRQRSGGEENVLTLSSMEGLLAILKYVSSIQRVLIITCYFRRIAFPCRYRWVACILTVWWLQHDGRGAGCLPRHGAGGQLLRLQESLLRRDEEMVPWHLQELNLVLLTYCCFKRLCQIDFYNWQQLWPCNLMNPKFMKCHYHM